jgi:hypothetical protein
MSPRSAPVRVETCSAEVTVISPVFGGNPRGERPTTAAMLKEPISLSWWRAVLCGALLAAGCTTDDNPLAVPEDFAGAVVLEPQPVFAWCTPGAFKRCDGDAALRCNAGGNVYDLEPCEHGCSEAAGGCNPEMLDGPPR